MIIPAWAIWLAVGISVASAVYSAYAMQKAQKKNKPEAGQLDGTIADEGVSFMDIAGSPHMYGNITDIYGQTTTEIKTKGGKK